MPSAGRGLPSTLVRRGGEQLLFDCGEGTQRQLVRSVGLPDLDAIFITHFHADHWLGLPGMLKTFDLRGRDVPLTVYGPPGLRELLAQMRIVYGRLSYPVEFTELEAGEGVGFNEYQVVPFAVQHRGRSYGYALVEEERPGRFDDQLARNLGVEFGPDFGRLQSGKTVNGITPEQVIGPTRPSRKVVLSGDTTPCEALAVAADHADLLIHEATFTDEEVERAAKTGHSTARQAAELAQDAAVKMLALVHLSTRYTVKEVRKQAQEVLPGAVVARDFDTVELPFAERGEPSLVPWSERSERQSA